MRILIFVILISIFASCDHPKKPYIEELTWPKRTVKLDNDLGILTISLPEEFDTFYRFDYLDCTDCISHKKYRFQQNGFPYLKESGGYFRKKIDSMYYFTISHTFSKDCLHDKEINEKYLSYYSKWYKQQFVMQNQKAGLKTKTTSNWQIEEIAKINDRTFFIVADTIQNPEYLIAPLKLHTKSTIISNTIVKDQILHFEFNCAASNCDSFIPKMYKVLKTVQIKPN